MRLEESDFILQKVNISDCPVAYILASNPVLDLIFFVNLLMQT